MADTQPPSPQNDIDGAKRDLKMNDKEFNVYCDHVGLDKTKLHCDLETLNLVLEKLLTSVHYSSIPLQLYPKIEIGLAWTDIFRRLIKEKRGGVCYEICEIVYQVLTFLGFDAHRLECQTIRTNYVIGRGASHLAVAVLLNSKWYLCDAGWGGVMFNNAMEMVSGKPNECSMGIWRTIGLYGEERSTLDPTLPKYWEVERRHHDTIYINYDNYEQKASTSWSPEFRFILESAKLTDYEFQCHTLHTDKTEFCNKNSFLAAVGYTSDGVLNHTFVVGKESIKTEFLTSTSRRVTYQNYEESEMYNVALKMDIHPDHTEWDARSQLAPLIKDPRTVPLIKDSIN